MSVAGFAAAPRPGASQASAYSPGLERPELLTPVHLEGVRIAVLAAFVPGSKLAPVIGEGAAQVPSFGVFFRLHAGTVIGTTDEIRPSKRIVGPSTFPAIVSENVWRGVCAVLSDQSRRRSQSNKAVHLLAGIAQCHCGGYVRSATVTSRSGEKHRIYRCGVRGPGHVSKRMEYVDKVVNAAIVAVRAAHDRSKTEDSGSGPEAERLGLEATALRKRQEEAGMQAALGQIPMHMLGTINSVIEKELAGVTAAMARLEEAAARQPPTEDEILPVSEDSPYAVEWAGIHIDDRRDYLRSICNVVLLPHGKGSTKIFSPDTVQTVVKAPGEGPGPMDVRAIGKLAAVSASLATAGSGAFVSFHVGNEVVSYRIPDALLRATKSEEDLLDSLIPLDDGGAARLQIARDKRGVRGTEEGLKALPWLSVTPQP